MSSPIAVARVIGSVTMLFWTLCLSCRADEAIIDAQSNRRIQAMIEAGSFAEAESQLRQLLPDVDAPVASPTAIRFEIFTAHPTGLPVVRRRHRRAGP